MYCTNNHRFVSRIPFRGDYIWKCGDCDQLFIPKPKEPTREPCEKCKQSNCHFKVDPIGHPLKCKCCCHSGCKACNDDYPFATIDDCLRISAKKNCPDQAEKCHKEPEEKTEICSQCKADPHIPCDSPNCSCECHPEPEKTEECEHQWNFGNLFVWCGKCMTRNRELEKELPNPREQVKHCFACAGLGKGECLCACHDPARVQITPEPPDQFYSRQEVDEKITDAKIQTKKVMWDEEEAWRRELLNFLSGTTVIVRGEKYGLFNDVDLKKIEELRSKFL